jgi:hypothetical protein
MLPDGVQALPAAQLTHEPTLHTMSAPHETPLASVVPLSVHVAEPWEHEIMPVWHGLVGVQFAPAEQSRHVPSPQTFPAPQFVPAATLPASIHNGFPVPHAIAPVLQGFATVQDCPALQAAQTPPPQTMSVPQEVPSATEFC